MKKIANISLVFVVAFFFMGGGMLHAQGEDFEGLTVGDTLDYIGWADGDLAPIVVDDTVASGSQALKVIVNNYNSAPVLEIILPEGKTLADYEEFTFQGYFAQGDVGWKDIIVEAYDNMPTGQFNNGQADVELGSWNRATGAGSDWEDITVDITNSSSLSDTIYIAFGIHASGSADGNTTIWYADDVELVGAEAPGQAIADWGFLGGRAGGDADWGLTGIGAGEVTMGDSGPPSGQWAALRGAFSDTLTATTSEAVVVTGQLEIIGGGLTSWSPLRYGIFHHDSAGVLEYAGTDSVAWTGREDTSRGYMFTPRSGTNDQVSGQGGNGSAWSVNGGNWISTWSGGTMTMGVFDQAPRRAEMTAGTYDFAFSIQPQGDGTNEVKWYLIKSDNSYWFGGSFIDTSQVATAFNGICFGINGGNGIEETGVTGLSLSNVTAQLSQPITVPEAPFSSFYVDQWGSLGGRNGWPILNDSTTLVGDGLMGADGPPDGVWATIRGGFGGEVEASQSEAIRVTGQIEFDGSPTSWSALRYGLFRHDSIGTLENQYTDSAAWSGNEDDAYGYMFTPRSGTNVHVSGQGGNGTQWKVEGGSWISTWSGGTMTMGVVDQAPRRAELTAGTYDFAFSVQPQGDGTNEVRWYLMKEDESYWFGGSAIDTAQATTTFNGVCFGINGGNGIGETDLTGMSVLAVEVDKGDPVTVPDAPWEAFYVSDWGLTSRGMGWPILNDSSTVIGNASMGGDQAPTAWATMRGGFGTNVEATTDQAVIVTGKLEYAGAGTGDSYVPLRYAFTSQTDTLGNPVVGNLDYQYTDSAAWADSDVIHYGYEFTPRSGATVMANGAGGEGTIWTINGGAGWNSTWSNNGGPLAAIEQAPRRASITEGVYDWAISVQPQGDGTNEVRWYLFKEDESYWIGGTVIDTAQVTTQFNGVCFGIGDDLPAELTEFNVMDVQVDKGDPITVPDAPFESFYVSDWGFIGDRFGGWSLTPGELVGNVTISGDDPPTDWAAVRGGFGQAVTPTEEEALVVSGAVEFVDGGFEDWSSFRYGIFYSDSAGSLDSTETNGYVWNGTENHNYGYLFLPLNGGTDPVDWQGIGESGTFGGVVDRPWLSTNGENDYVLGSVLPWPGTPTASAGLYNFAISVEPQGDGTSEVKFKLVKDDESYVFAGSAIDDHEPLATEQFNSIAFATNSTTATAMNITNVQVDLTDPIEIPTGVEDGEGAQLPTDYALKQNYPNPFNPTTTIEFALPKSGQVNLVVYDLMGRVVETLVDQNMNAGYHSVNFDASDLSSGMYFYKLTAGDYQSVEKMTFLK